MHTKSKVRHQIRTNNFYFNN